jgi:phospholipase C
MNTTDRRRFLQLMGGGAFAAALPASIARAAAIPANNTTGSIMDVEHIVILMQENRSFDHYFGSLNGVRGFGDPRPAILTTGNPVWYQPDGASYVLPFHPPAADLGLQFLADLAHDWTSTHAAWNLGNFDQWVPSKGTLTMAYLTRDDIPFHYALADAFTICDAYHCSLLGPTDPNRFHMWTGWVGNDGTGGGPALDNDGEHYSWGTYPEKLLAAGITWKIYQDIGFGLDPANFYGWAVADPLIGNYADNTLLFFNQYADAPPTSPLYMNAETGTNVAVSGTLFDELIADIAGGTLPQVSWIVAPEGFSEHPNWPANYGAWYVSQVLDALTANPDVWSTTALFICYDENDGFFDHMVPVTPPTSRQQGLSTVDVSLELFEGNETYAAGPIGLGMRVPMLVVSPWSRGGYMNSQVFDHTSLIRFIEARFGTGNGALVEPNITPWRRCVSGDLTSAFNFKTPNDGVVTLPSTTSYVPPNSDRQPSYAPNPPTDQSLPAQEPGQRPARALPYRFNVNANTRFGVGIVHIEFENPGNVGAGFQVRANDVPWGPWTYTVGARSQISDDWPIATQNSTYDLEVFGPNGFVRQFKGGLVNGVNANVLISSSYDKAGRGLTTIVTNEGTTNYQITAVNLYTGRTVVHTLAPGRTATTDWTLGATAGWYDIMITVDADADFAWRLAGHVENGRDSLTDPGIGTTL